MKLRNKISAVMAAGVIAMSMAAPTFALEHKSVHAYKNAITGEEFPVKEFTIFGKTYTINIKERVNYCFSGGVDLEGENLVKVYTKGMKVGPFYGKVVEMNSDSNYGIKEESNEGNNFIFNEIKPKKSSNLNKNFFNFDTKIKALGFKKSAHVDLVVQ